MGREMGRGCPPPQPTRGSGERRKLPLGDRGQTPGRKRVSVHLRFDKNLTIANRPRVSCAHNTLRASISLNSTP